MNSLDIDLMRQILQHVDDKHTLRLVSKTFRKTVDSDVKRLRWNQNTPLGTGDIIPKGEFPKLHALHLCSVGHPWYRSHFDISRFSKHLRTLEFSRCHFQRKTLTTLRRVKWEKMTTLKFSECAFEHHVSEFISQCPNIHTLEIKSIEDFDWHAADGTDGAKAILEAVLAVDMPFLEVLDISDNRFNTNEYSPCLGSMINMYAAHWPLLKVLDVGGSVSYSDPEDIEALCHAQLDELEFLEFGARCHGNTLVEDTVSRIS